MIPTMIPTELVKVLNKLKSPELTACVKASLQAGNALLNLRSSAVKNKGDEFVRHHAIVTEADLRSQEIILKNLFSAFPDSYAIAEEESERFAQFSGRLLSGKNYLERIRGHVFLVDSLDGTSNYERAKKLGQWGISISTMRNLEQRAASLYFPMRRLLVFAAKGKGAYKWENGKLEKAKVKSEENTKNQFVYFGVDAPFSGLSRFLEIYSANARTANTNGSCALGMALVTIGEADVFIQPLQRVWDPHAGCLAIKEAGGEVIWYTIVGLKKDKGKVVEWGEVRRVDNPQEEHYNPATKPLGFVAAGSRRTANHWFDVLKENYGK